MTYLKNSFIIIVMFFGLLSSQVSGGDHVGKGKAGDGFRKAAKDYDKKSEDAKKAGKEELAKLFARQAEIKRINAKLSDEGKKGDWKEYYKIDTKIGKLGGKDHGKKDHDKKHHKKKDGKPGDGFREAADKYDEKAKEAEESGNKELAKLFKRQAEIKRSAAKLGDDGKWKEIDWKEYKENDKKIHGHDKKKKHHKKKKH